MKSMFSIARAAAVATLALGAGVLLTPAPAEAQGRHGFSGGGGARFAGARVAGPRMVVARGFSPRGVAPRFAGYRPGIRPVVRHGVRPGHYGRGWNNRSYFPVAAGVGLGIVGAAAIANSGYYYANDGYYGAASYPQSCWLERRTLRTGYGPRVVNVRVCPQY